MSDLLGKSVLAELETKYQGKRVRFIRHLTPDPDPLTPGDVGTVMNVDAIGTLGVTWDSGRILGLTLNGDEYELTEEPNETGNSKLPRVQ